MEEKDLSVLKLDGMYFERINYSRKLSDSANPKYEIDINRKIEESPDGVHYRVVLSADIKSENDDISMYVTLVGLFECECDDEEQKKHLIYENAIAILFPYLRSQVTLVSTQPSIPPIVLPPVNIISLFSEKEEKQQ